MGSQGGKIDRVDQSDIVRYLSVQQFLFEEAALLDVGEYERWTDLLAHDLHYYMPVRVNQKAGEPGTEFLGQDELAHFDDTRETLLLRVNRLIFSAQTGMIPAENPRSQTRRLISNIRVKPGKSGGECEVYSLFIVNRIRLETQQDTFYGARKDLLRSVDSDLGWQIARREIHLDLTTVTSNNLNVLF